MASSTPAKADSLESRIAQLESQIAMLKEHVTTLEKWVAAQPEHTVDRRLTRSKVAYDWQS
ncbi:MAG: hypothetical protein ACREB9_00545 [Thermoplasmata archaeon]